MRDQDQLILDAIGGRTPNAKQVVRANCPFCELVVGKVDRKQCLEVKLNGGWWKCYRCESEGRLHDLPYDITTLASSNKPTEVAPVNLPEGYVPLFRHEGQRAITTAQARGYLERRGITPDVIEAARIGACVRGPFAGRVIVPIYKGGKLAGYVGRIWKRKGHRPYMYNAGFSRADTIYNEEALYVTTREPVLVVEGTFDTFPFWPDAVAVLGKTSVGQIDMLLNARRPIAVVFDGDAHRQGEALAMLLRLRGKEAVSLKLAPGVDPDEVPKQVRAKAREAFAA